MDEDDDPLPLFEYMMEDPCHVVKSLPPTHDKRFDMFRHRVELVATSVCELDRVDLVEKLLNGGYVGVNEIVWYGTTLLGLANSIEMADLLISHGAVFKGRWCNDIDCFSHYICYNKPHMLEHFFNHPEFIYRNLYMDLAIDCDHDPVIVLLKRKRDRQRAVITMDELGKRHNTNVFTCLEIDEYL